MIKLYEKGVFLSENNELLTEEHCSGHIEKDHAKKGLSPGRFCRHTIRREI